MLKRFTPGGIAPPFSNYSHGVVVPAGMRVLHISGQVGIAPDGSVPDHAAEQSKLAFSNVLAVMAADGMGPEDIVELTAYVVGAEHLPTVRAAREAAFGDVAPASTMIFVAALAGPTMMIEVKATAAKAD
jgi:enamine deaminase RidA (YjgF/YER057c/UK114 family)